MLLPLNTDAPIYHFPWATIGLIVANAALFAATMANVEAFIPYVLAYGEGLHPVQWVSSVFLHADVFHLLGNMFFLWGFGLVVEGKLGWWRYLALYFGIAVVSGGIEQAVMLSQEGGSLGASGVIFGLMAISLVWAPKNEMTLFVLIFVHAHVFEASILVFCGLFIAWQVVIACISAAVFSGFSVGSEVLHLLGAAVGAVAGVGMLKSNLVDCEGWDVFSVMGNKHIRREGEYYYRDERLRPNQIATPTSDLPAAKAKKRSRDADPTARLRQFLESGDTIGASGEYEKLRAFHRTASIDAATLRELGEGLIRDGLHEDAVPVLREYLATAPADEDPAVGRRVRLKLAKVLLDVAGLPDDALDVLRPIDPAPLSPKAQAAYRDLLARAEAGGE